MSLAVMRALWVDEYCALTRGNSVNNHIVRCLLTICAILLYMMLLCKQTSAGLLHNIAGDMQDKSAARVETCFIQINLFSFLLCVTF